MTKKKSLRIIVSLTLIVVMCCGLMVSSNAAISSTWRNRMATWGTYSNGSSAKEVRVIQRFLICYDANIAPGVIAAGGVDGSYGSATKAGVEQFQRAKNLDDDGVVGQNTWRAMADVMYQTTGIVSTTVRLAVPEYSSYGGISGNIVDCALYSGSTYWHYTFNTDGNRNNAIYFIRAY